MNAMEPARERAPDKMTVFQKCVSSFNQPGVAADRARVLLTDLVRLFYLGETFNEADATQLFFTITRLFQKDSAGLKQMVYLAIKELAPLTDNVIMGTSVLMRDVQTAANALCKAPALRALCAILDASAVESMDRLMRSTVVDKDDAVACAALVSAYHLLNIARDTVKRWSNEVAEAARAPQAQIAQYHALGLLYEMRAQDSVALVRLVLAMADVVRDPAAMTLHVRIIGRILRDGDNPQLRALLQAYLQNRNDAPVLEAAKTILALGSDPQALAQAAVVLAQHLTSPRAVVRFAAVRAVNRFAVQHAKLIAEACNETLEALIADSNLSVATFAITALLKTGSPASVDSLISQISQTLTEIPDDFRLTVVDAVRSLAKKFPAKHARMLEFFAENLRHESGRELKFAIVSAIADVLESGSADMEKLDAALFMLAESIEDSEYPQVTVRVLHLLGAAGPRCSQPETLVRYIYNRVILENSAVRAAAISALSKFQDVVPEVKTLLARSRLDSNDEVRDRAAIALVVSVQVPQKKLDLAVLEERLLLYLDSDAAKPFDAAEIPVAAEPAPRVDALADPEPELAAPSAPQQYNWLEEMEEALPQISELGKLLHTGPERKLTDDDMEYIVNTRAHVFEEHLVIQFNVTNNFDLDLVAVHVELDLDVLDEGLLLPHSATQLAELKAYTASKLYVVLKRDGMVVADVPATLHFLVDGAEDEYPLGEVEIVPAVYVVPQSVPNFDTTFAELGNEETSAQIAGSATLANAAQQIQEKLGMFAVDGTVAVPPDASLHVLKLYGRAITGAQAAATVRLVHNSRSGVVGKLHVHSDDPDVSYLIAEGF